MYEKKWKSKIIWKYNNEFKSKIEIIISDQFNKEIGKVTTVNTRPISSDNITPLASLMT